MFKLDLEKAEEPEIKLPTSGETQKKQKSSRKTSTCVSLTMPKTLTVYITTNCGKFFKRFSGNILLGIAYNLTYLLKNLYAGQEATVRTGHGTTDWFQIGKGVHQGCILSLYLFNLYAEYIMRNAGLEEAQAGIKISRRNINNLICRRYHPYGRKWRELKSLLMKVKEKSERAGLKLNIQKIKIVASSPITSWQIDEETVTDFIFGGSKITANGDWSHEIKRCLLLGREAMTNLDSIEITLPTKVSLVKAVVFPVVMNGCENWTKRKLSAKELILLNCGVGGDSWESLGTRGDQTSQS